MLIITIVAALVFGFVFQLIAILTTPILFGIPMTEAFDISNISSPEQLAALKYAQIIGALGTFIISSLFLSRLYTNRFLGFFTARATVDARAMIMVLIFMIASLPFINWLAEINLSFELPFDKLEVKMRRLHDQTEKITMTLVEADHLGALIVNLLMIAIIPAVGEELLFRGLIQKHFQAWFKNAHLAVFTTAVFFSLAHFQLYSFLPRLYLGLLLGYMFYFSKSLWYPIVAHFVNNGMAVLYYFFSKSPDEQTALDEIGTDNMMPVAALFSFVIITGIFFLWLRIVKTNQSPQSGQS